MFLCHSMTALNKKQDKNPKLVIIGNNIRRIRERLGLSQEDLALLVGLHRTFMGNVERGENNISILNLISITSILKVSIADILSGIDLFKVEPSKKYRKLSNFYGEK